MKKSFLCLGIIALTTLFTGCNSYKNTKPSDEVPVTVVITPTTTTTITPNYTVTTTNKK